MKRYFIYTLLLIFSCTGCTPPQNNNASTNRRFLKHLKRGSNQYHNNQPEEVEPEINFDIIEGQPLFNDSTILIHITTDRNRIVFEVKYNLGDSFDIPKVYESKFHKYDEADKMNLKFKGYNSKHKKFSTVESKSSYYKGKGSDYIAFTADELKNLKVGEDTLEFEITGEPVTFFDYKSGQFPIKVKIRLPFKVEPIYKSRLYFKSLKLNPKTTSKILGDNDFNNGTPEAGIRVFIDGRMIIFGYSANSYNYSGKLKDYFYHNSMNDELRVATYDIDYFLNSDDLISDTLIQVNDLIGTDYKNYPIHSVDELLIYCTTEGIINENK